MPNGDVVVPLKPSGAGDQDDHFKKNPQGEEYAGDHLLVDLYNCRGDLSNTEAIERMLKACAKAAGATLLFVRSHVFLPSGGISGIAVLAESHISIHTWPERGFAAIDLFMCGDADPSKAIPVIEHALRPRTLVEKKHDRGDQLRLHPAA